MITIPVLSTISARYSMSIELPEDSVFGLEFAYNAREVAWYMSIYDSSEQLLLAGIKLIVGLPLLETHRYIAGLPKGDFILVDKESDLNSVVVDFDSLKTRYDFLYLTESEMGDLYGV